ncbi:CRIB domain-containing protein [Caenorhabditis elegans]|uniref:CRIB domain-containing protein n=1 Tax=Caenorhabditis elegans TaxID=6239 RepID=Q19275_CAEEL|nr:CRIB domain-containing protein [Caenorhabditis elegans]CCD68386.1 CRIB domain-containing protein [Caenorhabditis elegans]|eukprot:NP_498186.1 Uncharacterized protein CELE_F09F7.5 [Caenorhabditis elegans]
MPNDLPLLPPKNQHKHLDKTMISLPSDFRHLAHVGPMGSSEIENLRTSDNVIDTVNESSYYIRPSSSNSTLRSQRKEKDRVGLDDAFPSASKSEEEVEVVRGYENQPTSHQYINIAPPRPSKKNYKAPAPPTPPPQNSKPNLIFNAQDDEEETSEISEQPVVFRSISHTSNISTHIAPPPKIQTADRIVAPKPNSLVIERPGDLGGAFSFGLDDCIPIVKSTPPLNTLSPLHRPLAIPKNQEETPILSPASPPDDSNYMSTIRSTSVQGRKILDELDDWLDDLDDLDRDQLSTISTDESGYPTLALEKDRAFMKHLVEKYELGVAPETIRLRKKKGPAPKAPSLPPDLSSPTFQAPGFIPAFSARPVSMPPNRPPPSYEAPSFDAPEAPGTVLINGRALTKQNALDLRSSDESGVPPAIARFLYDKRIKSATMPMSIGRMTSSSGNTDVSTTSSRSNADTVSSILSTVGEDDDVEVLKRDREVEEEFVPPVPKPRSRKTVSTEPLKEEEEENVEEEIKGENVIGEEFQVVGDTKINDEQEDRVEATKDKINDAFIMLPPPSAAAMIPSDSESEDDDNFIITRF